METILYRYYDYKGKLLYIGITSDFDRRHAQHYNSTYGNKEDDWPGLVQDWTLTNYPDRNQALNAEAEAIRIERPAFNVVHNTCKNVIDIGFYKKKRAIKRDNGLTIEKRVSTVVDFILEHSWGFTPYELGLIGIRIFRQARESNPAPSPDFR